MLKLIKGEPLTEVYLLRDTHTHFKVVSDIGLWI